MKEILIEFSPGLDDTTSSNVLKCVLFIVLGQIDKDYDLNLLKQLEIKGFKISMKIFKI